LFQIQTMLVIHTVFQLFKQFTQVVSFVLTLLGSIYCKSGMATFPNNLYW